MAGGTFAFKDVIDHTFSGLLNDFGDDDKGVPAGPGVGIEPASAPTIDSAKAKIEQTITDLNGGFGDVPGASGAAAGIDPQSVADSKPLNWISSEVVFFVLGLTFIILGIAVLVNAPRAVVEGAKVVDAGNTFLTNREIRHTARAIKGEGPARREHYGKETKITLLTPEIEGPAPRASQVRSSGERNQRVSDAVQRAVDVVNKIDKNSIPGRKDN